MKKHIITFFIMTISVCAYAQTKDGWEKYYEEIGSIEDTESEGWESTYDILNELAEHPIDLNAATEEDLKQLIFLTDEQREELSEYLYKYAPVRSIGELSMIESLDYNRRMLLSYFVFIGDTNKKSALPKMEDIMKYGKHEIVATAKIPLYERKGDKNGYLGYKYKHWLRYTFQYSNKIKIGLVGSQDSGEPFFANRNKWGYDYYSFYFMMKNIGKLKTLVVGRYRLKFGMGLVINNDFGFGKIATLNTLGSTSNSIRAHSSRSEGNYLQGAAATVSIVKGLDVTGFVSYRDIDATLNKDSMSISTIVKDGYHRTQTEMNKKHNTSELLAGGNVRFFKNGFHIGATGFYSSLNRELKPKTEQTYRLYYAAGKSFWNISTDYGYINGKLSINGETATGGCNAVATINSISYRLTGALSLMALQRFYSYKYSSLYSQSFSDGGNVQNESGIYIGANWQPSRRLSVMAYTDYAYFAWPKYQISTASHSWDNLISATYKMGKYTLLGRYRLRMRETDNADKTALIDKTEHRGRLSLGYSNDKWQWRTQGDVAYSSVEENSFGWMLSQNLSYTYKALQASATIGYFNTDDYDSRVYMYEQGTLYNFYFPMFYGEGIRYAFRLRADISNRLMLICKVATTDYFDRDHISSSYQQINQSAQTDVDIQLRWKF